MDPKAAPRPRSRSSIAELRNLGKRRLSLAPGAAAADAAAAAAAAATSAVVDIGAQQYRVVGGVLDLRDADLESREAQQLAGWLTTSDGDAVTALRCGDNPGLVGALGLLGRLKTADAHAAIFQQLCNSLKRSQVTDADFSSCGMGPQALDHLVGWVRDAIVPVRSLALGSNVEIGGGAMISLLNVLKDVRLVSLDISKTGCGVSTIKKIGTLLRDVRRDRVEETNFRSAIEVLTIDSTGDMGRQQTYTLAGTDKSIELSHKGIGCVDILLLSKWLTIPAVATAALLSLRGANYGDVYAVGDRVFRVKAPHGGDSVSFHNSPHADDRCDKGVPAQAETIHTAVEEVHGWVRFAENKWLPTMSLSTVDTRRPCAFEELCDSLKVCNVTIVDVSECGLETPAMKILAECVQEAGIEELNVSTNDIHVQGAKFLAAAIAGSSLRSLIIGPEGTRLPVNDTEMTTLQLSNQEFSAPEAVLVSAVASTLIALTELNISQNPNIGDDGAQALAAIIHATGGEGGSALRRLVIGPKGTLITLHDAHTADICLAGEQLSAAETVLVAAAMTTIPVARLGLADNSITGSINRGNMLLGADWEYDLGLYGLSALCRSMAASKTLTAADLSNCRISKLGILELSKYVPSMAGIATLSIDSTGLMVDADGKTGRGTQKPYTLASGMASGAAEGLRVNLRGMNLGHEDVSLLTAWLQKPKVNAIICEIDLSQNPQIGRDGADQVMEAIRTGQNTSIVSIVYDAFVLREEVCIFFSLWPKLTSRLRDAEALSSEEESVDEQLARFAAENGHPIVQKFMEASLFTEKTVAEFLHFLVGKRVDVADRFELILDIAAASKFIGVRNWAKNYGTLRPRGDSNISFRLIGLKVHSSDTCVVIFAENVQTTERVCLKFMNDYHAWMREKTMRQLEGGGTLDENHVVGILHDFVLDEDALRTCAQNPELQGLTTSASASLVSVKAELSKQFSASALDIEKILVSFDDNKDGTINHDELKRGLQSLSSLHLSELQFSHLLDALDPRSTGEIDYKEFAKMFGAYPYGYLITMPAATSDLSDTLSHDHIAGVDLPVVTGVLRQVGLSIKYMHQSLRRCHGDLKPRNICKVASKDGRYAWILIDLDASIAFGASGEKTTSSAFFSPEIARRELDKKKGEDFEDVLASPQLEMWYFGLLVMQLSTKDAPTLWQSTQSDNILKEEDALQLAYFFDTLKLEKVAHIVHSAGKKWAAAADLALWLLQGKSSRRPNSMDDVLNHRFFKSDGEFRYLDDSVDDTMDCFVCRQAEALTEAICCGDSAAVQTLFDLGGVHLKMLDSSIIGSTVSPLMRSAFVGDATIARILLDEIGDSWPEEVRRDYLDQRTLLDYTAYMIACACGHQDIANLLAAKGCSTDLVNSSGATGADLLQAAQDEERQSLLTRYRHGHKLHLCCESLESFLALLEQTLDEDVAAGIRVWHAKQAVYHFSAEQMAQFEATVADLQAKSFECALHFTSFGLCSLILHSKGIRASKVGQLGGGVSVSLHSLSDFGWGGGSKKFEFFVGIALWGTKWFELMSGDPWPDLEEQIKAGQVDGEWPAARDNWGLHSSKLETVLLVAVPSERIRDPARILPGRSGVYIIPRHHCIPAHDDLFYSNKNVKACLILKPPVNAAELESTRATGRLVGTARYEKKRMVNMRLAAISDDACVIDMERGSTFPPELTQFTATMGCLPNEHMGVALHHSTLEPTFLSQQLWLENVARFNPSEMIAGLAALELLLLHAYTLAYYYTTNEEAERVCEEGIVAQTDGNYYTVRLCLQSPSELGWQQNARGNFRQNVSELMGIDPSSVQAAVILGVPTAAIKQSSSQAEGTDERKFSLRERSDKLVFLSESAAKQVVYSVASVAKVYELEPALLVQWRKDLAALRKGEHASDSKDISELESAIRDMQQQEFQEGLPPLSSGADTVPPTDSARRALPPRPADSAQRALPPRPAATTAAAPTASKVEQSRVEADAQHQVKLLEDRVAAMETSHAAQLKALQTEAEAKAEVERLKDEVRAFEEIARRDAAEASKAEADRVALEQVQESKLMGLWADIDTDANGTLDREELRQVLIAMSNEADDDALDAVKSKIEGFDSTCSSGKVDKATFLVWWKQQDEAAHQATAEAAKAKKAAVEAETAERARLLEEKTALLEAAYATQLEALEAEVKGPTKAKCTVTEVAQAAEIRSLKKQMAAIEAEHTEQMESAKAAAEERVSLVGAQRTDHDSARMTSALQAQLAVQQTQAQRAQYATFSSQTAMQARTKVEQEKAVPELIVLVREAEARAEKAEAEAKLLREQLSGSAHHFGTASSTASRSSSSRAVSHEALQEQAAGDETMMASPSGSARSQMVSQGELGGAATPPRRYPVLQQGLEEHSITASPLRPPPRTGSTRRR